MYHPVDKCWRCDLGLVPLCFTAAHPGCSEVKSHLQRQVAAPGTATEPGVPQLFLNVKINTGKTQLLRSRIPYTKRYLDFLSERRINWPSFQNFLQNAGLVGYLKRAWSTHLCRESRHKSFPTIADLLLTHSSAWLLIYFQLLPCMLTFNLSLTIINH